MPTSNHNRPRKPRNLEPITGSCRLALQPTDAHPGCITLGGAAYLRHVLQNGYRLEKQTGEVYDLPADLSSCACADATYNAERPGGCKHHCALRAILTVLGFDIPTPAPGPACSPRTEPSRSPHTLKNAMHPDILPFPTTNDDTEASALAGAVWALRADWTTLDSFRINYRAPLAIAGDLTCRRSGQSGVAR